MEWDHYVNWRQTEEEVLKFKEAFLKLREFDSEGRLPCRC